jgi:kynurenine 3-monooxygenase
MEKKVIIVGAGLVGSLWAVYMQKAGYQVVIYERRSDIRKAEISAGKSINLALSERGWNSLKAAGVEKEIELTKHMGKKTKQYIQFQEAILMQS